MSEYVLTKDIRDNASYRESFYLLAKQTFDIDFRRWYTNGYWGFSYRPYCILKEDEVIANASVSLMTLLMNGIKYKAVQIGGVMTKESERGKGHSRRLIEEIIDDYQNQCDFIYLFANDTVREFYPKFGFVPYEEYISSRLFHKREDSFTARKLNLDIDSDRAIFLKKAKFHAAIGQISMLDNMELIMFYCDSYLKENLYYVEEMDAAIAAEYTNEGLYIHDVFCDRASDLEGIIQALIKGPYENVIFGFTPFFCKDCDWTQKKNEDDLLFILGNTNLFPKNVVFPSLSHA